MKEIMTLAKLNSGDYACNHSEFARIRNLLTVGKTLYIDRYGIVTDVNNKRIAWIKREVLI